MELRIEKENLIAGLHLTHGIADRKATVPILANVLIKSVGKDLVQFAATDLKAVITVEVSAKVSEEGAITVSGRQLYEIAKGLSSKEVTLRRTEQNWLQLEAARSEFKIVGMSERDYPKLPSVDTAQLTSVPTKPLWELIGKTIFSVSQDDTRPHLASILLESDGNKVTMVSTDGHRLSKAETLVPGFPKLQPGILIPRKGVVELRKVLEGRSDNSEVAVDQGYFVFKAKETSLLIKLGDGQFPPYEQVIPKENDKRFGLSKEHLVSALKRVTIIASEKNHGVRFNLGNGRLSIEVENPDLGNAKEQIETDYRGNEIQIGFNARYFLDVLAEIKGDTVILELGGDLDPAVIKSDGDDAYIAVIMPMRL